MFVDMAANQTRLGSANISRATYTSENFLYPWKEEFQIIGTHLKLWPNQQYEMGGRGIFNSFYIYETYERYETSWHEVCFVALLM